MLTTTEIIIIGIILFAMGTVSYGIYKRVYSYSLPTTEIDVIGGVDLENAKVLSYDAISEPAISESIVPEENIEEPTQPLIIQMTRAGKEIVRYKSLEEASVATSVKVSSIQKCLTGQSKTAGGFKWSVES